MPSFNGNPRVPSAGNQQVTRASFARSLLQALSLPVSVQNVRILVGWMVAEGGAGPQWGVVGNTCDYNPLNTTQTMPGSRGTPGNQPPVQAYTDWPQGLQATIRTLQNGNYGSILQMLKAGNASSVTAAATIDGSPWGTHSLTAASIDGADTSNSGTVLSASPGGTAGLGGRGTKANSATQSPFTVGDTSNPTEDFWTAINRLAQERSWYLFSDGETLYLADGPDLMDQTPAATIDRLGDVDRINHLAFNWDNSAFQFSSTHRKKSHIQRQTRLAKVTSPTEGTLDLICDIDEVRAGDIVILSGCGPGDGKWLVGDCRRSVFNIWSELTLVPALSPLSEQQVAGAGSNSSRSGKAASKPGAGTVIAAMISAAATINNQKLPYVWAGGHARVGTPSTGSPGPGFNGHTVGYDCSGAVAAVLRAGGMWKAASVGSELDIISTMRSAGLIVPGQGTGTPECTLFDNPGVHIYMRLDGQFWGTAAGALPSNGSGVGWVSNGSVEAGFNAYHIPQNILERK